MPTPGKRPLPERPTACPAAANGVAEPSGTAPTPSHALTSEALLAGRREVTILHGGEAYRLRLTRGDKLILTK